MISQHQFMYIKINHILNGKKFKKNIEVYLTTMYQKLLMKKKKNQLKKYKLNNFQVLDFSKLEMLEKKNQQKLILLKNIILMKYIKIFKNLLMIKQLV